MRTASQSRATMPLTRKREVYDRGSLCRHWPKPGMELALLLRMKVPADTIMPGLPLRAHIRMDSPLRKYVRKSPNLLPLPTSSRPRRSQAKTGQESNPHGSSHIDKAQITPVDAVPGPELVVDRPT